MCIVRTWNRKAPSDWVGEERYSHSVSLYIPMQSLSLHSHLALARSTCPCYGSNAPTVSQCVHVKRQLRRRTMTYGDIYGCAEITLVIKPDLGGFVSRIIGDADIKAGPMVDLHARCSSRLPGRGVSGTHLIHRDYKWQQGGDDPANVKSGTATVAV